MMLDTNSTNSHNSELTIKETLLDKLPSVLSDLIEEYKVGMETFADHKRSFQGVIMTFNIAAELAHDNDLRAALIQETPGWLEGYLIGFSRLMT